MSDWISKPAFAQTQSLQFRRRRTVAQKRAEDKRREQQREQQAFQQMAEEEAEKKRHNDAKLRAQAQLEKQRRDADEAERLQLDQKRQRIAALPKEVCLFLFGCLLCSINSTLTTNDFFPFL